MQDSQALHRAKCQAVFSTLLSMQILHKTMPQAFVRELFHETVRCDDVLDMSRARQAYVDTIDKQDLALVLAFQPPNNPSGVERAVQQLAGTARACLLNGLGWQLQLYHRLVLPVEGLLHGMLHK
jgi:hypothetical protein